MIITSKNTNSTTKTQTKLPKPATSPTLTLNSEDTAPRLRPTKLSELIGQEKIVRQLSIILESAKIREQMPEHILFYGQPGLGKTTLASLISTELACNFKVVAAPSLQKIGDIISLLINLEPKTVLFIDEIHRLRLPLEESLYSAMEDKSVDILVGKGNGTNTLKMDIPEFVLVGATTQLGKMSKPLKDRFPTIFQLESYHETEMFELIERSCHILKLTMDQEAKLVVCRRSRGIPRIANNILKRLLDFQTVHNLKTITRIVVEDYLEELGIHEMGLTTADLRYLRALIPGPLSLKTLSGMLLEDPDTIELDNEFYLIHLGFIEKNSDGRHLTPKGREFILTHKL